MFLTVFARKKNRAVKTPDESQAKHTHTHAHAHESCTHENYTHSPELPSHTHTHTCELERITTPHCTQYLPCCVYFMDNTVRLDT